MTTFTNFGLNPPILKALETEGYAAPTPIQAQAIPPVLAGRDLLGIAQTGTGKTAAFALPILQLLTSDRRPPQRRGCRALVLSPTRELATQIAESFRTYGRLLNIRVAVVFGGVGHRQQIQAMAHGVDVLVATPGRLLDHVGERAISLQGTEILVLDEADQMLDLGFVKPIRRIVSHLPQRRQNLFFSATMPREIGALASELLRDPVRVSVAPSATTVQSVSQRVIHVGSSRKRALLVELLADAQLARVLVFTRTKRGADRVARYLVAADVGVAAIHGNKSQRQREQALEAFRRSKIRVLVATDIAARGIDIDDVSHVVNYELPDVAESYVHRIGRTARAGATGIAISFCSGEEIEQLRDIERITRQAIPAEDRRNDNRLTADQPISRGSGRGHAGKQGARPSRQHDGRQPSASRGHDGRQHDGRQPSPSRHEGRQQPLPREHDGRQPSRNGRGGGARPDAASHATHGGDAAHNGRHAASAAPSRPRAQDNQSGMAGVAFMSGASRNGDAAAGPARFSRSSQKPRRRARG